MNNLLPSNSQAQHGTTISLQTCPIEHWRPEELNSTAVVGPWQSCQRMSLALCGLLLLMQPLCVSLVGQESSSYLALCPIFVCSHISVPFWLYRQMVYLMQPDAIPFPHENFHWLPFSDWIHSGSFFGLQPQIFTPHFFCPLTWKVRYCLTWEMFELWAQFVLFYS